MKLTYKDRKVKIIDTFTNSICENLFKDIFEFECIEIRLKDGNRIIIYPPKKSNGQNRFLYHYKIIQNEREQNVLIECVNKKDLFEVEFVTTDLSNDHYSRFANSIEIPICMIDYLY